MQTVRQRRALRRYLASNVSTRETLNVPNWMLYVFFAAMLVAAFVLAGFILLS